MGQDDGQVIGHEDGRVEGHDDDQAVGHDDGQVVTLRVKFWHFIEERHVWNNLFMMFQLVLNSGYVAY